MSRRAIIGLDVGGTKVAGGLLTEDDRLTETVQRSARVGVAGDPGLAVTRSVAEDLFERARRAGLLVDGIGAGFPEYVDASGWLTSHEVLAWTTQPRELLSGLAPVTVESDVRCAALGEGAFGVARGLASYAYVNIGTGLSHALVEDGQPWPGARGEAIALGELEVTRRVDGAVTGNLERYASGEGVRERFIAATGREVADAAEVFRLSTDGDETARSIVDSAARAMGAGLATLVALVDPGAIVIGGGVASAGERWRNLLETSFHECVSSRPAPVPILWATLGGSAGIIGAAIAHRRRSRV